jgi:hypothetical protein
LRTSNSGQPHFWEYNIAVHPRQWLNYLLAYTSVDFDEDDWENIADGILNMATRNQEKWTIKKYSEVLHDKLGHDGKTETLEKFMIESPRNRDIKRGLEEKDGNKVEEAIIETAGNEKFCQAFKDSLKSDEDFESLTSEIKRLRDENEDLKAEQQRTAQVVSNEVNVNPEVSVESTSESSAVSTSQSSASSKQEIINDVNQFVEMLDNNIEGGIESSDIPSPPEDTSNLQKTKKWLEEFSHYVDTSSKVAQAAKLMAPTAAKLSSDLTSLI